MSSSKPAKFQSDNSPDTLEVAPGFAHDKIEGSVPELASDDDLRDALEKAFDYRGDVTITLKNGSSVEGYVFDRRMGATLAESVVRVIPRDSRQKVSISFADIVGLAFTGRDMAAGKSWENWVRNYWQKKMAGEKDIGLHPETLE